MRKRRKKETLSSAQALLRRKSASIILGPPRPPQQPRSETPKHLKDLGRDYSRYPFASPSPRPLGTSGATTPLLASSEPSLLRTTTKNPYSDSEANLEKWGYPDDSIGALEPYFGGEKGFVLYVDELEDDDRFHVPADDDDQVYRPHWKEYCTGQSLVSTCGAIFLVLGLICVFILLPVLTFTTNITRPKSHDTPPTKGYDGPEWAHVNDVEYDLLKNVRTTLIDPDTPDSVKTRKSTFDDTELELVFSDEFSKPGRTFYQGDDPFWTAPDIWYGATQDMEWYDPAAVTTANGTLQLRFERFVNHGLQFRSGMLNSWNQLCFKGGVFEISVSLAGPSGVPGLWPGAWTLGNLGRPGYKSTTDGIWPYTYNTCDAGITPNQSDPTGLSFLPGQRLNSCTCKGEDHPNPGVGRGAPEIDILEASVDPINRIGVVTQSYQVAPFDVLYRPNSNFLQIPDYETTQMNGYCGGPFQQAVSGTTLLNNSWYDAKKYQKYAFEYVPGTTDGKIAWFVGEKQTFMMDGRAIGPNGNVKARQVSEEPMSLVLNLGMSGSWSQIIMGDLRFPTVMYIDYVRIYQKPGETILTCDPPGYPTTEYIKNHPGPYNNPNITRWNETGYSWPKNELMHGC
ncbi:beta-glucan synthesis-associated [Bisporella sp. PMI_857]|nr:beta-glucan synthesis-associated [Bisporella sp. PMI_857]